MATKPSSRVVYSSSDPNAEISYSMDSLGEEIRQVGKGIDETNSNILKLVKSIREQTTRRTVGTETVSDDTTDKKVQGLISSLYEWGDKTFSMRNIMGIKEGTGSLPDKVMTYFESVGNKNSGSSGGNNVSGQISSELLDEETRLKEDSYQTMKKSDDTLSSILKELTGLRREVLEIGKFLGIATAADAFGDFMPKGGVNISPELEIDIDPKKGIFKKTFDAFKSVAATIFSGAVLKVIGTAVLGALVGAGLIAATMQLFDDYKKGKAESNEFRELKGKAASGEQLTDEESEKLKDFQKQHAMGQGPYDPSVKRTAVKSTVDKETAEATIKALSGNEEDRAWARENIKEFGVSEEAFKKYYESQYGENATDETRKAMPTLSAAQFAVEDRPQKTPSSASVILPETKNENVQNPEQRVATPTKVDTKSNLPNSFQFDEPKFRKENPEAWKDFNEYRNLRAKEIYAEQLEKQKVNEMSPQRAFYYKQSAQEMAKSKATLDALEEFADVIKNSSSYKDTSTEASKVPATPIDITPKEEPKESPSPVADMSGSVKGLLTKDTEKFEPITSSNFKFDEEELKKRNPAVWEEFNKERQVREKVTMSIEGDRIKNDESLNAEEKQIMLAELEKMAKQRADEGAKERYEKMFKAYIDKKGGELTDPSMSPYNVAKVKNPTSGDVVHQASSMVEELKGQKQSAPVVVNAPAVNNVSGGKTSVITSSQVRDDDSSLSKFRERQYGF